MDNEQDLAFALAMAKDSWTKLCSQTLIADIETDPNVWGETNIQIPCSTVGCIVAGKEIIAQLQQPFKITTNKKVKLFYTDK